ncbi:MAG: fructosamine kinase family protein, partial [Acidobacteriota bacterium]
WLDLPDEPACLLHGDLWRGNVLADRAGAPVVIDPAVHRAQREADLAMAALFGGFPAAFYDAYAAHWPLAPEADARRPLFQLYHLLNHYNLFGPSYRDACVRILRRYAG